LEAVGGEDDVILLGGRGAVTLGEEVGVAPADDGGGPKGDGAGPSWRTVAVHGEKGQGPRR
jgi:hypothetical protein